MKTHSPRYSYNIAEKEALDPRNTGGKGAGLAKMFQAINELIDLGLPVAVPPALVLAPPLARRVLHQDPKIAAEVKELEERLEEGKDFSKHAERIRGMITGIELTDDLLAIIMQVMRSLGEETEKAGKKEPIRIAVRSSGLAEDLPTASFAGQYETILNVPLELAPVATAVLECLASVWGDRVVDYRHKLRNQGLKLPSETQIYQGGLFSIILQVMVDSEFSGVGFSIETETGHSNVFKSTIWRGLGELGVQGKVPTVEVFATKDTDLEQATTGGVKVNTSVQSLGVIPPATPQTEMMVWDPERGNVVVPIENQYPKIVNDGQAQLISYVVSYLQETAGRGTPVDVEFAWEGEQLYLLQVRPETVHAAKAEAVIENYVLAKEPPEEDLIGMGLNVGTKIVAGPLLPLEFGDTTKEELVSRIRLLKRILTRVAGDHDLRSIVFTTITSPPWEPIMKRDLVGGIVTELGNRTSHPAIISREEGLACSVGTLYLPDNLGKLEDMMWAAACVSCEYVMTGQPSNGQPPQACPECSSPLFIVSLKEHVTLDCSRGEARIYRGRHEYRVEKTVLKELPSIKTGVALNCGSPMEALSVSQLPGILKVGLAREEFIAAWIQVHPTFCVRAKRIKEEGGFWAPKVKEQFPGDASPTEEWTDKLALGMGLIGAAFYPREVILRFSDFKTNEYATLIGATYYELECRQCGKGVALKRYERCPQCNGPVEAQKVDLEPQEANPMMGWRGVSRYLDPRFHESFLMEVEALIRCHVKGLTNVIPMFPFVRHPEEAETVTELFHKKFNGAALEIPKIIFMAEVPSIGFVPYLFNPWCDGYSFGTNDYTQLITATDRDSPLLPFNEDVPAVKMGIAMLADSAHRESPPKELGICGQAPSDLPKFLRFLAVYLDYVSVNPDAAIRTMEKLSEVEEELRQLILNNDKDAKKVALELSKEFNLWSPFDPGQPGVTEFRIKWLMEKLGMS